MTMIRRTAFSALAASAILVLPSAALAQLVAYSVSGTFAAPATGSYSGVYVYDTIAGAVVSADISTTSGLAEDGLTLIPASNYAFTGFQQPWGYSVANTIPATNAYGGFVTVQPSTGAPTNVFFVNGRCSNADCSTVAVSSHLSRKSLAGTNSIVSAPPPPPIPTLSEWAMILLGVALAGTAALTIQRRRTT